MLRFLRYILEILAALIGVAVVCAILLAWKLSSMSAHPELSTPYIEAGIERIIPASKVHVGSSSLVWEGAEHVFSVHAKTIKIDDVRGIEIAEIAEADTKNKPPRSGRHHQRIVTRITYIFIFFHMHIFVL